MSHAASIIRDGWKCESRREIIIPRGTSKKCSTKKRDCQRLTEKNKGDAGLLRSDSKIRNLER